MHDPLRNFERKLLVHLGISGVEVEAEGADQRGQSEDHHHHHHHARDKRTGRPLEREFNFLSVMLVTQSVTSWSQISFLFMVSASQSQKLVSEKRSLSV